MSKEQDTKSDELKGRYNRIKEAALANGLECYYLDVKHLNNLHAIEAHSKSRKAKKVRKGKFMLIYPSKIKAPKGGHLSVYYYLGESEKWVNKTIANMPNLKERMIKELLK